MAAAGYSGTPLARKLGLREGHQVLLIDAPAALRQWLEPLPPGVEFRERMGPAVDLVHAFVTERRALAALLERMRPALRADAALWISWPKKSAKLPTDVDENVIRERALPLGFVDVKVCAVSEVWSALKLVIRKELR